MVFSKSRGLRAVGLKGAVEARKKALSRVLKGFEPVGEGVLSEVHSMSGTQRADLLPNKVVARVDAHGKGYVELENSYGDKSEALEVNPGIRNLFVTRAAAGKAVIFHHSRDEPTLALAKALRRHIEAHLNKQGVGFKGRIQIKPHERLLKLERALKTAAAKFRYGRGK